MSLRSKILLILAIVVGVFSVGDNLIQREMVGGSFRDLEEREASKDLQRVVKALEGEQSALEQRAEDWAATNEVIEVVGGRAASSSSTMLGSGSLGERDLHLVYICDASGQVLSARVEDPVTGEPTELRGWPAQRLSPQHPVLKMSRERDSISGLLMTEHGALLVGSHAVPADDPNTAPGIVVLGRFLDEELVQYMEDREQVQFSLWPVEAAPLAANKRHLLDEITSASGLVHDRAEDGEIQVYSTIADLRGAPTILVRADIEPEITKRGERSVNYGLLSTIGTGLLIMFVLVRLLTRIVIGPLSQLTHNATQIGLTDDTSLRTSMDRTDEIGVLSNEFDSMLGKLEVSKQEVIKTSRLAGMSEIATGVLHNVGNVLNSVNVSANLVTRNTEQLPVDDLIAMRDVLREHEGNLGDFVQNDEQGKHLLPFLDDLASALQAGKAGILTELNGMNRGVEHIGELVRSQQTFAGRQGVLEPTNVAEQIDAAIVICQQAGKGSDVEVTRDFEEIGKVEIDRHKLMEILVNLVKNAIGAMDESNTRVKRLKVSLERFEGDRLKIRVKDSGKGISEENLTRIFGHGFTTSKNGHGFGLHVSANAATEMKGSLTVESEGEGRGATFILELPAKEARVAVAA